MNWDFENEIIAEYYGEDCENLDKCKLVCGTDEAGRGPLAGDVYAAAVILPRGLVIEGLSDSKKITARRREKLYDIICEKAIAWGLGIAKICEIDNINILNASMLAMKRAVDNLNFTEFYKSQENFKKKPDLVLIDGKFTRYFENYNAIGIVKGDSLSPNIAAASIIAKVSRDKYMRELALKYPEYKFEKNKGYGTAEHIEILRKIGKSEVHRESFLGKILEDEMQIKIFE